MVINSGGGNKGKHVARKFIKPSTGASSKTVRVIQEDGEMYAVVVKLFGNCMCKVMCFDGRNRLCIIRKKFTGRRKTDNIVSSGSVVMVGLQEYSSGPTTGTGGATGTTGTGAGKGTGDSHLPRCNLLYVYNDQEKEKLRKVCDISKMNTAPSSGGGGGDAHFQPEDEAIKFVSSGSGVFNKYANQELRKGMRSVGGVASTGEVAGDGTECARTDTIDGASWLKDMYPDDSDEEDESGSSGSSESRDPHNDVDEICEPENKHETTFHAEPTQQPPKPNAHAKKYSIINIDDI